MAPRRDGIASSAGKAAGRAAVALTRATATFLRERRVGHLATTDPSGRPAVIPFCFAFDGRFLFASIDEQPRRVSPPRRRAAPPAVSPEVAAVFDHYDEDWSALRFVLILGRTRVLASGAEHRRGVRLLRRKYPQYRQLPLEARPILKIVPTRVRAWQAEPCRRRG